MRKVTLLWAVSALLLSGCGTGSLNTGQSAFRDPSRFTYTRTYCSPDKETHFQTVTVELTKTNVAPPASPAYAGGNRPVSTVLFVGFDAQWGAHDLQNHLNHPAPAAQFVVVLAGSFSGTTTDGETRRFRPGDVVLVEDTAPCKGHITVVGDTPGLLMFAR
jgi:hypothetical protein